MGYPVLTPVKLTSGVAHAELLRRQKAPRGSHGVAVCQIVARTHPWYTDDPDVEPTMTHPIWTGTKD